MRTRKFNPITMLVLATAVCAVSLFGRPSDALGQTGKKDLITIGNSSEGERLYDKIKDKASVEAPRLIAGPMWDYPKEGSRVPVLAKPISIGGGWKVDPSQFTSMPFGKGIIGNNHVASPALPDEVIAYARYNESLLQQDPFGKVIGGRVPVINYRWRSLVRGYPCLYMGEEEPKNWEYINLRVNPNLVDPFLNVLGYDLPMELRFNLCAVDAALEAAAYLLRFAPALHSPKEYHESETLYKEAKWFSIIGYASSPEAILHYRGTKVGPIRHFYNRKDSPLYFIAAAYPGMSRFVPDANFRPGYLLEGDPPTMTFYFFPVSPSGEVCYFENAFEGYEAYKTFDAIYHYSVAVPESDDALKIKGLAGVRCVSQAYSWADDYIAVHVIYKDGQWRLNENIRFPIRSRILYSPAGYHVEQEPFAWIRPKRYGQGPIPPSVHPFDALIRFYPPFARWLEKIERGEKHVVTAAELSLPLYPYSFAPGYALAPADPSLLKQDMGREIQVGLAEAALLCQAVACKTWDSDSKLRERLLLESYRAVPWSAPRYEVGVKIEYSRVITAGNWRSPKFENQVIYVGKSDIAVLDRDANGAWRSGKFFDYTNNHVYTLSLDGKSGKVIGCRLEQVQAGLMPPFVVKSPVASSLSSDGLSVRDGLIERLTLETPFQSLVNFGATESISITRNVLADGIKELCDESAKKQIEEFLKDRESLLPEVARKNGEVVDLPPDRKTFAIFVPGVSRQRILQAYAALERSLGEEKTSFRKYHEEVNVWIGFPPVSKGGGKVEVHEYPRIKRDGKTQNGVFIKISTQ